MKDGQRIEMCRLRDVDSPGRDRGWLTHLVTAMVDGDNLGRLTISWIPDIDERYGRNREQYVKKIRGVLDPSPDDIDYYGRDFKRFRAFHGEPFVAAVFVEFLHHRHHIGLALYREAALWLAQDWKLRLRQGDPNPTAEALWAKLRALGEPVVDVDVGERRTRLALDYCAIDAVNSD